MFCVKFPTIHSLEFVPRPPACRSWNGRTAMRNRALRALRKSRAIDDAHSRRLSRAEKISRNRQFSTKWDAPWRIIVTLTSLVSFALICTLIVTAFLLLLPCRPLEHNRVSIAFIFLFSSRLFCYSSSLPNSKRANCALLATRSSILHALAAQ